MVELILNELNTEITAAKALINGKIVILEGIDACGVIELSVNLFKTLFFYQTDALFDDNQVKYYTSYNPDFIFNAAESKLDHNLSFGAIEVTNTNRMFLTDDFIRYLAVKLFGTFNGVDLFVNEVELEQSLYEKITLSMETNYATINSLNYIDGSNVNLLLDTKYTKAYDYRIDRYVYCYTKYTTDSFNTKQNLCRELMLQILQLDPARFQNIQNTSSMQPLPFIAGDTINFKIGINAAEGQELLTNVDPILKRTYQIKIILTDTIYKTIPDPETKAIVNYIQSNPFPTLNFTNYSDLETYDYILFKFSLYLQTEENNIEQGINAYTTGIIKIYPKAFNGINTFEFSNNINGNSNYEIDASDSRMFYINDMTNINSAANVLSITIDSTTGDFMFNIDTTMIVNFQMELQNNGKLPIQYISSKHFDINFI
jgi:hypothetical protein